MFSFMNWLMLFLMMMSLFFWWFSHSMSVSMLMVLLFSIFSVMKNSFSLEMKVPLFMVILTLSGGLFVLVSLVVMFFSEDWKSGVTYAKKIFFSLSLIFFFSIFFYLEIGGSYFEGEMKVWGNFVFMYVYLIILLFLFLFVINLLINPSTGMMFSKKKVSMVH